MTRWGRPRSLRLRTAARNTERTLTKRVLIVPGASGRGRDSVGTVIDLPQASTWLGRTRGRSTSAKMVDRAASDIAARVAIGPEPVRFPGLEEAQERDLAGLGIDPASSIEGIELLTVPAAGVGLLGQRPLVLSARLRLR